MRTRKAPTDPLAIKRAKWRADISRRWGEASHALYTLGLLADRMPSRYGDVWDQAVVDELIETMRVEFRRALSQWIEGKKQPSLGTRIDV